MFYTVYKITNNVNGKIYIGIHKTKNLDDSYMGSGVEIRKDIKIYGKDTFTKEYISIFEDEKKMYEMESILVNDEFIKSDMTYNISLGGYGGWDYVNKTISDEEKIKKGKWLGANYGSIGGSWDNKEVRLRIQKNIPIEVRIKNGKRMGDKFGGHNKLDENEVTIRMELIKDVNLLEYGWVKKVSNILKLTHTQTRRFIKKYYKGEYYSRNSPKENDTID